MQISASASLKTIRAISAEFAWRLLKPIIILGVILALLLLFIGGWLTTQHTLWWILEFIFITSTIFFMILTVLVISLLNRFKPRQTSAQKHAVSNFADKLQRVADTLGISRFSLLFRVIRDVIRPQEQTFIRQITTDSTSLHTDFIKLQKQFSEQ